MHCLVLNPEVRFLHYKKRIENGQDVMGKHDNQTKRAICHYTPPTKCTKEKHIRTGTCECYTAYKHSQTRNFKHYGTPEFDRSRIVVGSRKKSIPKWNQQQWG